MANSLMIGSAMMGLDFRILAPASLHPEPALVDEARRLAAENDGRYAVRIIGTRPSTG